VVTLTGRDEVGLREGETVALPLIEGRLEDEIEAAVGLVRPGRLARGASVEPGVGAAKLEVPVECI